MLEVADTLPEVNISEHLNISKPYYWYHSVLLKLWLCISDDTDGGLGRWLHRHSAAIAGHRADRSPSARSLGRLEVGDYLQVKISS